MKEKNGKKLNKENNDLASKTALITGGSIRIGKEIAITLAKLNFNLVINFKSSESQAQELAKFIEEKYCVKVSIFQADLFKQNEVKKLSDFMITNFSDWNLLINNASIFKPSNFLSDDAEIQFNENLSIHLSSPIFLMQEFAKAVKKNHNENAQIINILDKNIARYETKNFYYLLTKKFLASATKMIALQLAPQVRVNGISPGIILPNDQEKDYHQIIPMKKIGEPKNITQTIEFLLKNNFITGQIIAIDGGASLNHAG